ncbi:MAG: peptidoglycan DD-metalloendopeptidase family protein [Anaerovorax sp.]
MNKRMTLYILVFLLLASTFSIGIVYATSSQEQLQQVQQDKKQAQKELAAGKAKERELGAKINSIEGQIKSTQNELANLQGSISKTEVSIAETKANLQKVEAEMAVQNQNLNGRLRVMYKNGNTSFLEILLGSDSITSFMTNMDMVQRILNNDVALLKTIEEQHKKIDNQKKQLEAMQAKLIADKEAEAAKQGALLGSRNEVATLKSSVAADNATISKNLAALEAAGNKLISEIQALQSNSKNPVYLGSGKLGWPVSGRVTSEFTSRISPITGKAERHLGLDIGVPSGTPVAAAEAGTVIKAGWNNSYGYMVIIDHGGGVATLYAHNSRLAVSSGAQVSRGQTISYAGSTGDSTGPHVHFEVRVNGQYQNPRGWL